MRFIQVGVGGFGKVWVKTLKENPDAEVVGMVDISDKALTEACEAGGYASDICFKYLEDALRKVKADAIVCATPPEYHKQPVITALKAGLHAISEKPMADTLANCKEMLAAAKESGRMYVVSQNYRYQPTAWTLAEQVRSGRVGTIGQVKVDFYIGMNFGGGFRHDMEYPLIIDMSIHHFDLMRFITGLDAMAIQGVSWNPPWSNYRGECSSSLVMEMNNGARVVYNASWCCKGQFTGWDGHWQIEGDKGTLTSKDGQIKFYSAPELYKVESEEIVTPVPPPRSGQPYVLADFIDAVKTGRRSPTDVYDNIRSIAMVFAAVDALRTGTKAEVLDKEIVAAIGA